MCCHFQELWINAASPIYFLCKSYMSFIIVTKHIMSWFICFRLKDKMNMTFILKMTDEFSARVDVSIFLKEILCVNGQIQLVFFGASMICFLYIFWS